MSSQESQLVSVYASQNRGKLFIEHIHDLSAYNVPIIESTAYSAVQNEHRTPKLFKIL